MVLETLLQLDSVPGNSENRCFLRQVRRDLRFPEQLYFISTRQLDDGRCAVDLWQNVTDGLDPFLSDELPKGNPTWANSWTLDECNKQITALFYEEGTQMIKTWKIRFETTETADYRPIHIESSICYVIQDFQTSLPPSAAHVKFTKRALVGLTVCPSSGESLVGNTIQLFDRTCPLPRLTFFPMKLQEHFGQDPFEISFLSQCQGMLTPLQSLQMEARSYVFSRLNELFVLFSYKAVAGTPAQNAIRRKLQSAEDDEGCMVLYSYDSQLQPINALPMDPLQLVRDFLPKTVLEDYLSQIPEGTPERVFFAIRLRLLGHVHKYVLFALDNNYIFAAKWSMNWYAFGQRPGIFQKTTICVDRQKKYKQISDACLVGTDVYLICLNGKSEVIGRLKLGQKLKDYRCCAHCGLQELGKRRNKRGKRIAKFKVCRLCKKFNFHHCYEDANFACHYCSNECQLKHWKEHKVAHSTQ